MKINLLKQIPWALCSLLNQLVVLYAAYYLYDNDYGYDSGRAFSYFLSFSYFVLGVTGIFGIVSGVLGMIFSVLSESWFKVTLKMILIYIPCLFLSVVWGYLWLVLLAWI